MILIQVRYLSNGSDSVIQWPIGCRDHIKVMYLFRRGLEIVLTSQIKSYLPANLITFGKILLFIIIPSSPSLLMKIKRLGDPTNFFTMSLLPGSSSPLTTNTNFNPLSVYCRRVFNVSDSIVSTLELVMYTIKTFPSTKRLLCWKKSSPAFVTAAKISLLSSPR